MTPPTDYPETIALVALKGGAGKTTSAVYLAEAIVSEGFSTAILDTDPQASASKWAYVAAQAGTPLSASFGQPEPGEKIEDASDRVRAETGAQVVVIDTPPGAGDRDISLAAARASDCVIVPARASQLEAFELRGSLALAQEANRIAAVLQVCSDIRMKDDREFRDVLEGKGILHFRNVIPYNVHLKRAGGRRPDPHKLYGYAWVWRELLDPDDSAPEV